MGSEDQCLRLSSGVALVHTHIHICVYTHKYTCVYIYTCAYIHYTDIHTYACVYTCICIYMHMHIHHTCIHIDYTIYTLHIYACIYTYTCIHIHAYAYIYTPIYTHTRNRVVKRLKQKDCKFGASLGCRVKPCFQKKGQRERYIVVRACLVKVSGNLFLNFLNFRICGLRVHVCLCVGMWRLWADVGSTLIPLPSHAKRQGVSVKPRSCQGG